MNRRADFGRSAAIGLAMAVIAAGAGQAEPGDRDGTGAQAPVVLAQAEQSGNARIRRQVEEQRGPVTNLPLPRYVSLKGSKGNVRRGPSLSHRIDWVFQHSGMPLRVVAEFGHWRRVEDKDGAGGWVHYALLSGVRTAVVTDDLVELRTRANPDADVVAKAEAGAIARLKECSVEWCEISASGLHGWVPKTAIWGVDPDEIRE